MLELELENAILRAYPDLLPDLQADGYEIKSAFVTDVRCGD